MKLSTKIVLSFVYLVTIPVLAEFKPLTKLKRSIKNFKQNRECPTKLGARRFRQVPIVFHDNYDIGFWGIEKLHPFDAKKYGKVFDHLNEHVGLQKKQCFVPSRVTDEQLKEVHSPEYLTSLTDSSNVAHIAENWALSWMPNSLVQTKLLDAMRYATGGTILGAHLALDYGWAINLSGGYHHAKANAGEGFCFFADIPLAAYDLWKKHPNLKIMVVDLDAHQGNGHEAILKNDKRIAIFDLYNNDIFPHDRYAQRFITYNYPLSMGIKDHEYLGLLREALPKALDEFKPDLIIYNAGTDIFEDDPLGGMKITFKGIIERDELVFTCAQNSAVPILMLLSGGYTKKSSEIIANSIENLHAKKIIDLSA